MSIYAVKRSAEDHSQYTATLVENPESQGTLPITPKQGENSPEGNRIPRIAGCLFTPRKEERAQQLAVRAQIVSPLAREVVARQERYKETPGLMGVISPKPSQPRRVFTTPLSHRTVESEIGSGAQGKVFRVERTFTDKKREKTEEALKTYSKRPASWNLIEVFSEAERRYLNIPSKVAMGENGVYVACLPLAEGDLHRVDLSQEESPAKKLLSWMRDVAEGVEVMHEKGIIHRDLKPANILVLKGRDVAQAADLDLAAKEESGFHFTSCTPFFSHPSIWEGDIMNQKNRKGIQTKADDSFSMGRTIQYGVIGKVFNMHDETKGLSKALFPKRIVLPENEKEVDRLLVEYAKENAGPVVISNFRKVDDPSARRGLRFIPSVVHLFPSQAMLRAVTLHGIEELKGKLDSVELEGLKFAAGWAHSLQADEPTQRPTMADLKLGIQADLQTLNLLRSSQEFQRFLDVASSPEVTRSSGRLTKKRKIDFMKD